MEGRRRWADEDGDAMLDLGLTLPAFISEIWRYSGPFTRWNRFKNSLPGFGIACVAFAGYCAYEQLFLKKDSHGHGAEHH